MVRHSAIEPPSDVDIVVVHQFDPTHPSPGGIDTCIRGICAYLDRGASLAIVGVDAQSGDSSSRVGQWERHSFNGREVWFLPVASFDPADQRRRIPHSIRLSLGLIRRIRNLPKSRTVQAHRMDTAVVAMLLLRRPLVYFVHTQRGGLTGRNSDSFWRFAGRLHEALEKWVVGRAQKVVVFNESYAQVVAQWNPHTLSSPTWFDPSNLHDDRLGRSTNTVLWVGRLEKPKNPSLAIQTLVALREREPDSDWSLNIVGSGTLAEALRLQVSGLSAAHAGAVTLVGRQTPEETARLMGSSAVFLMTSVPGYEGYPRVLVEAMASGMIPVVTVGSDTGNLVDASATGSKVREDPSDLADGISTASRSIDREAVRTSVRHLSAPEVVAEIYKGLLR